MYAIQYMYIYTYIFIPTPAKTPKTFWQFLENGVTKSTHISTTVTVTTKFITPKVTATLIALGTVHAISPTANQASIFIYI